MKRFIVILTLILILSLIPYSVFAKDSLNISRWIVNSSLLENGDLSIVEDITFEFNDKFNGVFRNIVLEGSGGIKDFSLFEMVSGEEIEYSLSTDAKKGDTGLYMIIDGNNEKTIQIFSPSNKGSKTFRLKYTLNNLAINHRDTGELYYKFLGEQNTTPIDYFSATIHLPRFEKERIKIFGHGPLNGEIQFVEDYIKLEVEDVSTKTFIEARVLFPLDYIPSSNNPGNSSLDNIINEETTYSEELVEDAARKEKVKTIFNYLSLIFSAITLLIIGFFSKRFKRNPKIFEKMSSIYPESISPAELSIFMGHGINTRTLLASLFDLASREYLIMEEIEIDTGSKNKRKFTIEKNLEKEFLFIKTSKSTIDLLDHERFLMDWLFKLGNGKEVSTLTIENYRKKHLTQFTKALNTWTKKVQENLESRDYYDPSGKKASGYILIISLFGFIIGLFSALNNALYGILLIILALGLIIYTIHLYTRKSDKGHIQHLLWKDFKDDISALDRNKMNISEDKTLIYAIALGIPMKELNDYRETISRSYYPMYWGYWYFLTNSKGGSQLEDRMGRSFYGSYGSSSSSSTGLGGGGGFSGGGGGGAGGGGAGGF